jgi:hypothetical protein
MRLRQLLWILPAILGACADYGAPDSVSQGVVVYTQPQSGFDFTSLTPHNYYLDTNVPVDNNGAQSTTTMPASIESAIVAQMTGYGWTRTTTVPHGTATTGNPVPEVALNMGVFVGSSNVYYPGYWCGSYYYYYSCYYGGWYYAGTYTLGTVVLEMTDVTGAPTATANIRWAAVLAGSAYSYSGSGAWPNTSMTSVVDATNRAFGQSPYLNVQ